MSKARSSLLSQNLLYLARLIVAKTNDGVPAVEAESLAQNRVVVGVAAGSVLHDGLSEVCDGRQGDGQLEVVVVAGVDGALALAGDA